MNIDISKEQMREACLRSTDVAAFDLLADALAEVNDQLELPDVAFYADLARRSEGTVVELGVGDGRVARHVLPDVGVDLSGQALQQCRRRIGGQVQLIEADLAAYQLDQPAAFSYAALNTFNHISGRAHLQEALRNTRTQTESRGLLAFDVALPDIDRLRARDKVVVQRFSSPTLRWEDVTEVVDAADGLTRVYLRLERFDKHGRTLERLQGPPMPFRFLRVEEIISDLECTGWRLLDIWGDFQRSPLFPAARTAVCLAEAWGTP